MLETGVVDGAVVGVLLAVVMVELEELLPDPVPTEVVIGPFSMYTPEK